MAENPWALLDKASVRIRELEAQRDDALAGIYEAQEEIDALRRAVKAVREWAEGWAGFEVEHPVSAERVRCAEEALALLAAARIEAGLNTSRERPPA